MTTDDEAALFKRANEEIDLWSNVTAHGGVPAPDLTMRSIIALRDVLGRHQPVDVGSEVRCSCGAPSWPDADARSVLAVVGLPEPEEA